MTHRLAPGVAVAALGVTTAEAVALIDHGQMAQALGKDIIFIACGDTETGYGLTEVMIAAVRNGICHVQSGCSLYLPKAGARAVILPQPHVRGHFRLAPGELIQIDRKPADVEDGVARAGARMARLVAHGVDLDGRAVINTYPLAA
ncbi:hypothetical protein [Sphingomonas aracearum]|uniref:Uncharacterized protein n=1 Tax=Sphingomonas aracearum TaxID=2283317 RepID=A0A369VY34_9SPHN|nr:hypothetical protein [Sphingomonas aracearum]RDE05972.1 hypothetical protein DVW87_12385 [Sphingomonas aracearum]